MNFPSFKEINKSSLSLTLSFFLVVVVVACLETRKFLFDDFQVQSARIDSRMIRRGRNQTFAAQEVFFFGISDELCENKGKLFDIKKI